MEDTHRVALLGSDRTIPAGAREVGAVDAADRTSVSIVVRRANDIISIVQRASRSLLNERDYPSRERFAEIAGASAVDMLAVERFALDAGLLILQADRARRTIVVEGSVRALAAAFDTDLRIYDLNGERYRGRIGLLTVPASLAEIIVGVFGLDERPQARAQFRVRLPRAVTAAFSALELAQLYAFPADSDGTGQTVAVIELGGGYRPADLDAYFKGLGMPTPIVTAVSVDGGQNAPTGNANSADAEVELDIEVAGAIAPGANVVVYFAPNTDQGFLDAITTAVHDTTHKPSVISISWGSAESAWTQQALTNFDSAFADAAALGITVCVAAGDNGSTDSVTDGKQHVDFPASSPHVLACGGTSLRASGTAISAETVWNAPNDGATGGGISDVFPLPAWQNNAHIPPSANADKRVGRGVPDVSGDADPATGYNVFVDGATTVVGGTSAVAPLWAGLIARLNQHATKPLGFINPLLYANPSACRDITSGSNGAYVAGPGWDACTGLGSPNGVKLRALVQ